MRQLDDDQWARRESAEQALLKMGPDILSLLPDDSTRMSLEARQRLARVRNQLQIVYARQAVEASRVTLQGTMTLGEALQSIEQSTGNVLKGYSNFADRSLTLDLENVPFWEALDHILDQASLTIYPYAGDDAVLRIMQRDPDQANRSGVAYYEGVFRIEPTYVAAVRDLVNPTIKGLRVRLSVTWEPRTKPIAISIPLAEITARDDRGNSLQVDGTSGRLSATVEEGIPIVEMEVPLELPEREAHTIERLQGTFDVMVPGMVETFEFGNLDKGGEPQQRRAGVTVTLKGVRKNEDVQEISVLVEFDDASNALESHRGWIFKNDAFMRNAAGKRVEYGGRSLLGQDENSIHMSYMFALDAPLAEYTFVYRTPALIIRQPMQFTLKNIKLP